MCGGGYRLCATLSAIFFFFLHSFSLHLFVSRKSLNDEERGDNCLLVPERSYRPVNCKLLLVITRRFDELVSSDFTSDDSMSRTVCHIGED